ncbi:TctA family transporter [Azospirillum sp. OGB3]|uniref:hypothetical protein n=1 Tax=Azospirillum sp. OGB3 TaxID=2587012 RepID=UPI001605DB6A|nr:hypothetical protein [Azospirillum sp. OGB3]MBB3268637.1 TctA family transporter [Azospirillum sp. OGB3]
MLAESVNYKTLAKDGRQLLVRLYSAYATWGMVFIGFSVLIGVAVGFSITGISAGVAFRGLGALAVGLLLIAIGLRTAPAIRRWTTGHPDLILRVGVTVSALCLGLLMLGSIIFG